MHPIRSRAGLAGGALVLLTFGWLGEPAGSHVEPTTPTGEAGRRAEVGFVPTHGCDTAPTTGIDIQLPDDVIDPIPRELDGWTVSVDDRVVSWDGGPLADGDEATFAVDVLLPDTPGVTLYFPTIQRCPSDQSLAWTQQPGDGTDQSFPAPAVAVVEATGPPGTTTPSPSATTGIAPTTNVDATSTTTVPQTTTAPVSTTVPGAVLIESASDSGGDPFLPILIALVGALAVAGGAFYYFRGRGSA